MNIKTVFSEISDFIDDTLGLSAERACSELQTNISVMSKAEVEVFHKLIESRDPSLLEKLKAGNLKNDDLLSLRDLLHKFRED